MSAIMPESSVRYEEEIFDEEDGDEEDGLDGTMPNNVDELRKAVVGHRIISVKKVIRSDRGGDMPEATVITLDNGKEVRLIDTAECYAYTEVQKFLLHPELVDHAILGVGTTDGYTTWHIFADYGDVLELTVGWSPGSGWYGYGFDITVEDIEA